MDEVVALKQKVEEQAKYIINTEKTCKELRSRVFFFNKANSLGKN